MKKKTFIDKIFFCIFCVVSICHTYTVGANPKCEKKDAASTQDRTTDLQFTRLALYHWAIEASNRAVFLTKFFFILVLILSLQHISIHSHISLHLKIRKQTNYDVIIQIYSFSNLHCCTSHDDIHHDKYCTSTNIIYRWNITNWRWWGFCFWCPIRNFDFHFSRVIHLLIHHRPILSATKIIINIIWKLFGHNYSANVFQRKSFVVVWQQMVTIVYGLFHIDSANVQQCPIVLVNVTLACIFDLARKIFYKFTTDFIIKLFF